MATTGEQLARQYLNQLGAGLPTEQGLPSPQGAGLGIPPPAGGVAPQSGGGSPPSGGVMPSAMPPPQPAPVAPPAMSGLDHARLWLAGQREGEGEVVVPEAERSVPSQRSFGMMPEALLQQHNYNPPEKTQFRLGVESGIYQIGTDIAALGALGSTVALSPSVTQDMIDLVKSRNEYSHLKFPKTIEKVEDIASAKDFAVWAARAVGEQIPVVASIMVGGGIGGLLGKLVAKGAVKKSVAQQLAVRFGAAAGAVGTATAIETGATAGEQIEAIGEVNPTVAITAGVAKGALEAVVPLAISKKLGLTPSMGGDFLSKIKGVFDNKLAQIGAGIVATGAAEAITETLQESVDVAARAYVDENYNLLGPESASRILNAAATGGVVGAILGPLAGSGRWKAQRDAMPPDMPDSVEDPHNPPPPGGTTPPPPDVDLPDAAGNMPDELKPTAEETIAAVNTGEAEVTENSAGSPAIYWFQENSKLKPRGVAVSQNEEGIVTPLEQGADALNPANIDPATTKRFKEQVQDTGINASGVLSPNVKLAKGPPAAPLVQHIARQTEQAAEWDSYLKGQENVPLDTIVPKTHATTSDYRDERSLWEQGQSEIPFTPQPENHETGPLWKTDLIIDNEHYTTFPDSEFVWAAEDKNSPGAIYNQDKTRSHSNPEKVWAPANIVPMKDQLIDTSNWSPQQIAVKLFQDEANKLSDRPENKLTLEPIPDKDLTWKWKRIKQAVKEAAIPLKQQVTTYRGVSKDIQLQEGEYYFVNLPHSTSASAAVANDFAGLHSPGVKPTLFIIHNEAGQGLITFNPAELEHLTPASSWLVHSKYENVMYENQKYQNVYVVQRVNPSETYVTEVLAERARRTSGVKFSKNALKPDTSLDRLKSEVYNKINNEADSLIHPEKLALVKRRNSKTTGEVRTFASFNENTKVISDWANKVWKTLNIPNVLELDFEDPAFDYQPEMFGYQDYDWKTGIVNIAIRPTESLEDMKSRFAHELGHALTLLYFNSAPIELRTLVERKFLDDRYRAIQDWDWALVNFFSSHRAAFLEQWRMEMGLSKSRAIAYIREQQGDYWYGKNEWFAEQMAKIYDTQDIKSTDPVDTWMQQVAKKLKEYYEIVRQWLGLWKISATEIRRHTQATREYRKFVEYLLSQQRKEAQNPKSEKEFNATETDLSPDVAKQHKVKYEDMPVYDFLESVKLSQELRSEMHFFWDFLKSRYPKGIKPGGAEESWLDMFKYPGYKEALLELEKQGFNNPRSYLEKKILNSYFRATDEKTRLLLRKAYGIPGPVRALVNGAPLMEGTNNLDQYQEAAVYNITRYLNAVFKELKISYPLEIYFHTAHAGTANIPEPTRLRPGNTDSRITITLRAGNGREIAGMYSAVIHEVGHLLRQFYLREVPYGQLASFQEAYNEARIKAETSYDYMLSNFVSPFRAIAIEQQRKEMGSTPAQMLEYLSQDTNVDYWFGFDQWFAEQVHRTQWVHTSRFEADNKHFRVLIGMRRQMLHTAFKYLDAEQSQIVQELFQVNDKGVRRVKASKYKSEKVIRDFIKTLRDEKRADLVRGERLQALFEEAMHKSAIDARHVLEDAELLGENEFPMPEDAGTQSTKYFLEKLGVPKEVRDSITVPVDRMNGFMKMFLNIIQIAKENPHITQLQRYVELVDQWYVMQTNWMTIADTTLKHWVKLTKQDRDGLARMLIDFDERQHQSPHETAPRKPTEQEVAQKAKELGLSTKAVELYYRIQNDFGQVWDRIRSIEIAEARRLHRNNEEQLAVRINEINEKHNERLDTPYFPRMRFGKFAVAVRDASAHHVLVHLEHYDSSKKAKAAMFQLNKRFKDKKKYSVVLHHVPENARSFQGLPLAMLETIRKKLGEKMSEEQLLWLDTYIEELSIATKQTKEFAKRHGVGGRSQDVMRAYARYFFDNAKHFARVTWGHSMERTIYGLKISNQQSTNLTDIRKRDRIVNWLEQHYEYIMNPKADWAGLRAMAFNWWIGFHVKSAAVNLTQVPLVTVPYLSNRFGSAQTAIELTRAYTGLKNLYNIGDPQKISPEFALALKRAVSEGVVDESQATELAGLAQGSFLTRHLPESAGNHHLAKLSHWAGLMFQTTEKMNRRVTFRAAYELALKNPDKPYIAELLRNHPMARALMEDDGVSAEHITAYLVAKDAVRTSQFPYAGWARPQFMWGKKGVLFTFFMFLTNMLYFTARGHGKWRFILMLTLAAGLMGAPGAEDIAALAKWISRKFFGKDFDLEKTLREAIVSMIGDDVAPDLILHGGARYGFGLGNAMDAIGLPKAQVDISGSLSLGRIVPGMQQLASGEDFETAWARATEDMAGASYGVGFSIMRGLTNHQLPWSDTKRWESMVPRAGANVLKAHRFWTEGRERTRTGATVAEFDATGEGQDWVELLLVGAGFPSTKLAQRWDREAFIRESEKFWAGQRAMLLEQFDQSFIYNDDEGRKDALQRIREFNKKIPFPGARIQVKNIISSRKGRIRERTRFEQGMSMGRSYSPLRVEADRLYPEVETIGDK